MIYAPQKLDPVISSWDVGTQTEHAASSFPREKCHPQTLPIITIENHQPMP